MPHEDELVIRIRPDLSVLVEDTNGGVVSCKEIAADAFLDCVKSSVKFGTVKSGVLPCGCISYSRNEYGQKICVEYPGRRCNIRYENTLYPDFPLPRLIFGFEIHNDGRIMSVSLCVPNEGMLTPKTPLYLYPFSNVYGFSLCCGANRLPPVKSPHQLRGIMHLIMSMPNNNDHYSPNNSKLGLEYRHLLETLKDKSPDFYYSDVLIPSGKTLNDFI